MKSKIDLTNKKAIRDYEFIEEYESGIVLSGNEAKSIREGKVDFSGAYVKVIGLELYLVNLHIGVEGELDTRHSRKLLMNKREILAIDGKVKEKKLTLLPIRLYNKGRLVKLKLALARSRKNHDKRDQLRKRDVERDIEREIKEVKF